MKNSNVKVTIKMSLGIFLCKHISLIDVQKYLVLCPRIPIIVPKLVVWVAFASPQTLSWNDTYFLSNKREKDNILLNISLTIKVKLCYQLAQTIFPHQSCCVNNLFCCVWNKFYSVRKRNSRNTYLVILSESVGRTVSHLFSCLVNPWKDFGELISNLTFFTLKWI